MKIEVRLKKDSEKKRKKKKYYLENNKTFRETKVVVKCFLA